MSFFSPDKTFNIPIYLWLEENYPRTAPICYVRPTHEMMLVRRKFISNNGEVKMPYLEEWKNVSIGLYILFIFENILDCTRYTGI